MAAVRCSAGRTQILEALRACLTDADQAPPDRRLIAALPWRYDRDRKRPGGYFNPSNILKVDDAYYALAWARPYRGQKGGACVLRTTRLDDPSAWRAWDGHGYRSEEQTSELQSLMRISSAVFCLK